MITKLKIENFRSIESAEIDLGRINVLTGSNNSGKSSFIYALLGLANFIKNPNQHLNGFFNFKDISLGGFQELVFDKNPQNSISIAIQISDNLNEGTNYILNINNTNIRIELVHTNQETSSFSDETRIYGNIEFSLPYSLNKKQTLGWKNNIGLAVENIAWNGVNAWTEEVNQNTSLQQKLLIEKANLPLKTVNEIDFVPVRRNFTKVNFGLIPLFNDFISEDEIASKLAIDNQLEEDINFYLEKILNKRFKVDKLLLAGIFRLLTVDKSNRFSNDLVNDGLGTNQIIFILFKALQKNKSFICIDEPEIHLHPSIISKLVDALIEIAYEENKQFLISTHNEHLMSCLLASVADKKMKAEDLKVYYLTKNGKKTEVESQPVNEHGQISGGLKNFYEAELENLAKLFNIVEP